MSANSDLISHQIVLCKRWIRKWKKIPEETRYKNNSLIKNQEKCKLLKYPANIAPRSARNHSGALNPMIPTLLWGSNPSWIKNK